jgi:hypothetical protein
LDFGHRKARGISAIPVISVPVILAIPVISVPVILAIPVISAIRFLVILVIRIPVIRRQP